MVVTRQPQDVETRYLRPAAVRAESFDEESHTVEVVWTTGADVPRRSYKLGSYIERLSLEPGAVRLKRLNNNAPFLDTHSSWRLQNVLGKVVPGTASIRDGQGVARVKLSKAESHKDIVTNIREGIIANVSVGYIIHAEEIDHEANPPIRTATDWEPIELSAVPIGADDDATIRSKPEQPPAAPAPPEDPMTEEEKRAAEEAEKKRQAEEAKRRQADEKKRIDEAAAEAKRQEKARIKGIRATAAKLRGLPADLVDELIDDEELSLDQARAKLLDAAAAADDTRITPFVQPGDMDEIETRAEGVKEYILHAGFARRRVKTPDGEVKGFPLTERAKKYVGRSLLEICRMLLEGVGVRTDGWSRGKLARMALNHRAGTHVPTDLPLLLEDTLGKALQRGYTSTRNTFAPWTVPAVARDYKDVKRLRIGGVSDLEVIDPATGEYTYGTFEESREAYGLSRYGKIISISDIALINDDLSALTRVPALLGARVSILEGDVVYEVLTSNPTMGDGTALFHADHNNLTSPGGTPSSAQFETMRVAMINQVGLGGEEIDVFPAFVLCPHGLFDSAWKGTGKGHAHLAATASDAVNPLVGGLEVIPERRLDAASATRWYMSADPGMTDTVEVLRLEGETEPVVERMREFDSDAVKIKIHHSVAAKALDHVGLARNGA